MTSRNFVDEATREIDRYQPNTASQAAAAELDAVAVMSAFGAGCDTVLQAAGIDKPLTCTTEDVVPGDPREYIGPAQRKQFIQDLRAGNFTLVSQHPYTRSIDALRPESLPETGLVAVEIFPTELPTVQSLFRSTKAIYLAAPLSEWKRRTEHLSGSQQYLDQACEAHDSLTKALASTEDICFVANKHAASAEAADTIKQFLANDHRDERAERHARELAYDMLKGFGKIITHERRVRSLRAQRQKPAAALLSVE